MQYSHLHCHTQYSLLDGAAKISAMFKKAAADKMPAIAITDHGNMFGVFEFVAEASKHKDVKPIVGCEFYLVEDRHKRAFTKDQKDKRFHQLFLAKNAEGYRNLTKMCSLGFIEGLYGKYPRIDKELILQYHKGLIATTCCLGAEVPQAILTHGEAVAREKFKWWLNLFGEDYYVELQRHKIPDQIKVNEVLLRFAKEFNVKIIASNDSHYVDRADSNAHDILLCLNTGERQSTPKMDDFDEGVSQKGKRFAFFNDEFYFKTTAEMQQIFPDLPQALDNTNEIVAKIEPLKLKRDILLPNFVIPQGFTSQDEYLTHLTYEGAKARYKEITQTIEERLNFELFTVRTMGFAGYFLIVADFIRAGRDMGVFLGPGRGCLVGNTKVILKDGRTKNLEHIEIGDNVWTKDGSLQTVTNRFEYPVNETLLNIKSYYGEAEGVTMTKDHKVLAEKQRLPKNWDNWAESTRLACKKPEPTGNLTWMPACELAVGDWVFIPTPNFNFKKAIPTSYNIAIRRFEEDSVEYKSSKAQTSKNAIIDLASMYDFHDLPVKFGHKIIPPYLELDDDWFTIFGLFAGDGWWAKGSNNTLSFVFNVKDETWITFFKNKMASCGFAITAKAEKKIVRIHVRNKPLCLFFKKIFNGYQANAHSKHVPDIVINGNESQILSFLKGYCAADGHESPHKIKFTTVSRDLADQVRFICWCVGIPANLSTDKRIGDKREMFKNRTLAYMVTIPKDARIGNYDAQDIYVYRKVEGGILTKIRSISEVNDVQKVYDIEVSNNHNYLTSSFLVHNSAAGSAIAYCIGITNIDPIKYNLLFERFLNPDRKSMPDIDTDFDDEGRQKVIDYVVQKYGKQQVAQITTYGTMAAKMSIKDVSRVLDLPLQEANAMAKLVSDKPGIKLNRLLTAPIYGEGSLSEKENLIPEDIENAKSLREILAGDDERAKVLKEALILEGSVRGTGIHAAGIIIAPKDLTEIIPVYTSKETELLITQFEGSIIEDAGVIKMDFLGLKTLSIMRDALKLIHENYGIAIEIDEIPLDDKKTYQLYQRGETNATFQFESPGMQKHLRDLKPDKFDDLIAMNALYRPGPLQYIPNFINRKHGREKVVYDLPVMEEYLHETYGICVTGDTLIYNPVTGERARMDSLENRVGEYYVQGVDNQLNAQIAPITHWVCNGKKAVVEVKLNNGSIVKMTPDHRVLTENGWQEIGKLKAGDYIATPRQLKLEQSEQYDRRQLRVLAYLLADGSMGGSGSTAEFVSKDPQLLEEYTRCLEGFERLETRTLMQVREVTRIMVAGTNKAKYHETNSLVAALRNWGLKTMKGGCTSDTKFIPAFVFKLNNDDIAFFLASYWDCDGHIGQRLCFVKTISKQIAIGIQTLLLRLGIYSTTYEAQYYNNRRGVEMTAYQVTLYNLKDFRDLIAPHLIAKKMHPESQFTSIENHDSVSRELFFTEFKEAWQGTYRGFMNAYGFDRQHLHPKQLGIPRIPINVVESVAEKLDLVQTRQNSNVRWVEIKQIVPIGEELVYDITVAGIHNFIGNNIILHNCIFQEQLMLLSQKLANFSKGDADVLRKAMGKKQLAVLDKMKPKFLAGCEKNGHALPICEKIWTDWEAFASYAFNKSHSTCYAFVAFQTAYLKAHYPAEYMAAVLTHGQGNLEKITFFMEECRSMGIAVKSPDVNESDVTFTVNKKGEIRYALAATKGVGEAAVAALIEERKLNGAYKDIFDFVRRSNSRTINKKVIESLAYAGALDGFGVHRATYFSKPDATKPDTFIEMLIKYGNAYQSQKAEAEVSLFGGGSTAVMTAPPPIPKVEEWNLIEKLNHEKEVVGIFLSGHPLDDFRMQVKVLEKFALDKLDHFKNQKVKIAAFVTAVNERISKKGTPWGAITIQDYKSSTEFTLFNDDYARHAPILKPGTSVYIEAEYKTRYNSTEFELKINNVKLLDSVSVDNLVNQVTIMIPLERITADFIDTMTLFCSNYKGKSKLKIQIQDASNNLHLKLYSLDRSVKIDTALLKYMDSEGWLYTLN